MSRGLMARSASGPSPNSSSAPGRMFCSTTSTPLTYALSQATSLAFFRSSTIERLPPLTLWKTEPTPARNGGPQPRASSPPSGRSTFTTSAPRRASVSPANGPARFCASSRTLMPDSGREFTTGMVARARETVGGSAHRGQPRLQAVDVLLVGTDGERPDLVAFGRGRETLPPGESRLAGLGHKRDRELEARRRHVLDHDALRRQNLDEHALVEKDGAVGTVHRIAPGRARPEIELVECVGEAVRAPPLGQVLRLAERAKHALAGRVEQARGGHLVVAADRVVHRAVRRPWPAGAESSTRSARPRRRERCRGT